MIIGVGIAVLIGLTVLLAIYFRKALFILSIPAIVTLLSAGAVFRRDHRFVWPLFGISVSHHFYYNIILTVFPHLSDLECAVGVCFLLFLQTSLHSYGIQLGF